jgi:hypothetical protein
MDNIGGIEHAPAHAQEPDMQTQAKVHVVSAPSLDRRDLGRAQAEELLDLEFAQPVLSK